MKCPNCGQEYYFRVEAWEVSTCVASLNGCDIGSVKAHETLHIYLDPDSSAECTRCGHENHLTAFGPHFPFPLRHVPHSEFEAQADVSADDLVRAIDDLLDCTDLSLDELDPSSIAAIDNAKRLTDAFKGVSQGGAT